MLFYTTGAERMRIDASGNVGIGTNSPGVRLDVAGGAIRVGNTHSMQFRNAAGTGVAVFTLQSDDNFVVYNAAGTPIQSFTQGVNSFAVYGGNANNRMLVDSGNNVISWNVNGSERMRIDSAGNVGIGTSSPGARLDVKGLVRSSIGTGTGAGGAAYAFYQFGTSATASENWHIGAEGDGTFRFYNQGFGAGLERMRITSGGEVYIAGTTDQGAYNLQVNGTGVWGAGAYVNGSDRNLKEEVAPLADALDVVAALKPVTFRYKEDYSKDQSIQPGFIAQELQEALADQVYVDGVVQAGPKHLNVAYQSLIPVLVKALQEANEKIDTLAARVAQLEGN